MVGELLLSLDHFHKQGLVHKDVKLETGFRLDLFVENCVIIELKVVERVLPIHRAQLLTYLRVTDTRLGYLINFNTITFKDAFRRYVL